MTDLRTLNLHRVYIEEGKSFLDEDEVPAVFSWELVGVVAFIIFIFAIVIGA